MNEQAEQIDNLEQLERLTIQRVVQQVHGDKLLAVKLLGISRATLYRKLKRYNIGIASDARPSVGTVSDS
jgi:transcriptional regulator of acetoin/glycerol metabolism